MLPTITAHSHVKYVHVLHHQYCENYVKGACSLSYVLTTYVIPVRLTVYSYQQHYAHGTLASCDSSPLFHPLGEEHYVMTRPTLQ